MSSCTSLDFVRGRSLCSESPLTSNAWWKTYFRLCTVMFMGSISESASTLMMCWHDLFALQRMEVSQQLSMSWQWLPRLHSPVRIASSLVQCSFWCAQPTSVAEVSAHSESVFLVIPKSRDTEESPIQWLTALIFRNVKSIRLFYSHDAFHPSLLLFFFPFPPPWSINVSNC